MEDSASVNGNNEKLIVILGPTAVGKTKFAAELASCFNGEIISADSRQVYKHMDIGTGKDYSDYIVNGLPVQYHLIDIVEPDDEFNLFLFKRYFNAAYKLIASKHKIPFLAGGTGLYLSSIIQNYKLAKADFNSDRFNELNIKDISELKSILLEKNSYLHNTTDLIDKERLIKAILVAEADSNNKEANINPDTLILGIMPAREVIKKRITERLKYRLENGMIEEVQKLATQGISFERLNFFGLEYRFIGLYLQNKITYNDMFQKLNSAIHNFAKRQATWFRKMEREGVKINWMESADLIKAKALIEPFLNGKV